MTLKIENEQKEHDVKSAIQFLKNLYQEIKLEKNIQELQNPLVLKKFHETIQFLEKILST